ncbi:MAG: hypothetical protein H6735_23705 [Alphaproteobacteria bacterium]|nr:hypothetical protein [Alphaproteobacteria bacterium]
MRPFNLPVPFIPTQPELDFPGRGLRFFLDDENFVANNGKPMAVFPFGAVAAPNRSNPLDPTDPFYSQPAEVYRMSLVGPDPSPHGVHDPDWPIQEVEPRRQMLMTRPPGYMDPEVQRVDAEPLSMQTTPSTRSTFVYYTTPTTIGGRGLRHRMRRALAE